MDISYELAFLAWWIATTGFPWQSPALESGGAQNT